MSASSHRSQDPFTNDPQTAGLTVAARLSEDPSVSVLVLEAGGFNPGDQLICEFSYSLPP